MKNRIHHKVIRIADDDHLTARALLPPLVSADVEVDAVDRPLPQAAAWGSRRTLGSSLMSTEARELPLIVTLVCPAGSR